MNPTLLDLWNGNVAPFREKELRIDEITHLVELIDRHNEALNALLDEKGRESLQKYQDCITELECITHEEAFAKGFSLAVKLMSEALVG